MPNVNPAAARTAAAAKRSKGKGRKVSKAEKARLLAVAAVEEGEAEVEVKDWSQQKSARQAQLNGSVKEVDPSPDDLAARLTASQSTFGSMIGGRFQSTNCGVLATGRCSRSVC
jgi:hypothetical protein